MCLASTMITTEIKASDGSELADKFWFTKCAINTDTSVRSHGDVDPLEFLLLFFILWLGFNGRRSFLFLLVILISFSVHGTLH